MFRTKLISPLFIALCTVVLLGLAGSALAQSKNALFIANENDLADTPDEIVGVLENDGWTVEEYYDVAVDGVIELIETTDLSDVDLIVWSASDDNKNEGIGGTAASTIAAIKAYVEAGGYVFVTGYDSAASPEDLNLGGLLSGVDGPIAYTFDERLFGELQGNNVLTQGIENMIGTLPLGDYDGDAIPAQFLVEGEAECVSGEEYEGELGCSMVVRSAGAGCIAYVSSGSDDFGTSYFSETNPLGTYYVQSAVFRNFAYNAENGVACLQASAAGPQSIPSMSVYGLIALALVLLTFAGRRMIAL